MDDETPDKVFERHWATALVERALSRLKAEMNRTGDAERTECLTALLGRDRSNPGYATVAARLNISESAVKVAIHRMRRRYGSLLREEVAQTVSDPDLTEAELSHLLKAIER
jgi:RNA polymerase sigma-70 factor (ECF subfamily)